jgi:hypothetical protein
MHITHTHKGTGGVVACAHFHRDMQCVLQPRACALVRKVKPIWELAGDIPHIVGMRPAQTRCSMNIAMRRAHTMHCAHSYMWYTMCVCGAV